MRILSIAFKDLLITLKDRKALALILLMPIALIFVLGMGLSSMFKQNGVEIKKFDVAFVNRDNGEIADHFKEFMESEEIKKMIALKEIDENEAMKMVKKGDLAALIVLPMNFSDNIKKGLDTKIEIYEDPGSPMRGKIVESLIKSFAGLTSSIQSSVEAVDPVFKQYNLDGSMILPYVMKSLENTSDVEFNQRNLEKSNSLSAMEYYSAAMLVMFILFVASVGTTSIIEERENKTLLRLMSTTLSKGTILAGKLLGLIFLGIFDVSALIIFTRFAYGVNWGSSPSGLILLSLSMIFAASGFAMFIATIFKTSKSVFAVSPAVIMVMSALGGSMFPILAMPPVLQTISKVTLNNWALRGYLSLMMDGTVNSVTTPVIVLFAIGAVFLTVGISRLRLN